MIKVPIIKHKLTVILLMTHLALKSEKKLNKISLWDLLYIVQVIITGLSGSLGTSSYEANHLLLGSR